MEVTILLDHDIEAYGDFLLAGLREIGWEQDLSVSLRWLRDYGLPNNLPDQEIWRFGQQQRIWLVTHNRNNEDETSLQATIRRENTLASLPVITISNKRKLVKPEYRRRVATGLVEIVISPEKYYGTGRFFLPQ